jgi:hypothetical protein
MPAILPLSWRCRNDSVDRKIGYCRLAGLTTSADRHRETVAVIGRPSVFEATGCRVQQRQSSAADLYVEDRSALRGRPVFRGIEGYTVVLELHDDCRIGKIKRQRDVVLAIIAVRMSEDVGDDLFEHELALAAGFLRQLTLVERPAKVRERTTEPCARAGKGCHVADLHARPGEAHDADQHNTALIASASFSTTGMISGKATRSNTSFTIDWAP